jgi:hypothetical protein
MPNVRRRRSVKIRKVASSARSEGSRRGATDKLKKGMKLKDVSRFVLMFAIFCLGAFMAGRPPDSVYGSTQTGNVQESGMIAKSASANSRSGKGLGHDNSRRFSRSALRQRKARTQEVERGA